MINNLNELNVDTICIISPGCNLKCQYCIIAKSSEISNDDGLFLQRTKDSLLNGDYLNNIKTGLDRLNVPPSNIKTFEIWGGEPTILFKNLTEKWDDWNREFSNLEDIGFSTNGVAFTNDIYNYIKKVDEVANRSINFDIQYSYDGDLSEKQIRGNENDRVIDNCLSLINKLNSTKLNFVKIKLNLHCVLSKNYICKLQSIDNVTEFVQQYSQQADRVINAIINKNLSFNGVELMVSNSEDFTTEDGIMYANTVRLLDYVKCQHDYSLFYGMDKFDDVSLIFGTIYNDVLGLIEEFNVSSLQQLTDEICNNPESYNNRCMCGTLTGYVRMDCDGRVYDCHGSIQDVAIDVKKLDTSVINQTRYYCYKHGVYTNIVKDSDQQIEKLIDFYVKTHNPSVFIFMYHQLINRMYLLASIGQISLDYKKDFNKIKRHALMLAIFEQCYQALKTRNGSIFLRGDEEIRKMCNGVMDYIESQINMRLEKNQAYGL